VARAAPARARRSAPAPAGIQGCSVKPARPGFTATRGVSARPTRSAARRVAPRRRAARRPVAW
jgi:hypothetical protein